MKEREELRSRQVKRTGAQKGMGSKPMTQRSVSETGGSISGHKGKGDERFGDRAARRAERAAKRVARRSSSSIAPSMYDNPKLAAKADKAGAAGSAGASSRKSGTAAKPTATSAAEETTAERKARELHVTKVVPSRRGRSKGGVGSRGQTGKNGRTVHRRDW